MSRIDTLNPPMPNDPSAPERHKDTARNLTLNRALSDLEEIINHHDPEVDCEIGVGVWDRLDKLACEIEASARAEARREALEEVRRVAVMEIDALIARADQ